MTIVETVGVKLYHGSKKRFAPGTVLKAQRSGYVRGSGMDAIERKAHLRAEAVLDKFRPEGAVPRVKAVFLCDNIQDIDNAGGYLENVYLVKPEGIVTRCNLHWYSELYSYFFDDDVDMELVQKLAQNYWMGTPSGAHDCFEYLVLSAQVVELVEEND